MSTYELVNGFRDFAERKLVSVPVTATATHREEEPKQSPGQAYQHQSQILIHSGELLDDVKEKLKINRSPNRKN